MRGVSYKQGPKPLEQGPDWPGWACNAAANGAVRARESVARLAAATQKATQTEQAATGGGAARG